ncbi:MAG: hypothetical protein DRI71_11560 [Bacteroidetes bacterium]|nr:MAG: hypothetical protein DRI71_11560 [Bacteroidota bacterium]
MKGLFFTLATLLISSSLQAQLLAKRQAASQDAIMSLDLATRGNLEEVLWYISDPIEIEREVEIKAEHVDIQALQDKGSLKISGGKYFEIYKITNGATGLLEYKKDGVIAIRYENGEGRFLEFKLSELTGLETVQYYKLNVKKADPNKLSGGTVHYAGADWNLLSGSRVILEFKAKGNSSSKTKKTKVKGLRKDGTERKGIKLPGKKH